jgi:hypothetical protein
VKKPVRYGLVALAIWWVIEDPASAAHVVHQLGTALTHAARSLTALISDSQQDLEQKEFWS